MQKFIFWYEATQGTRINFKIKRNLINSADAHTIEQYKDYLDGVAFKTQQSLLSLFIFWKKKTYPNIIKQDPLSIGSKKRHLSAIKNFYEYLVQANQGRNKLFLDNPVKSKLHSIRLKDADINHTKLLTPGQWEILGQNLIHPKEKLIGNLLYYGGLRLEELTRLQISDFSQRTKSLSFIRKGGQLHTIKLQEFDMIFDLLLKSLTRQNHACGLVFVNRFGNPISTRGMYQIIKKLLKRSGLQSLGLGPHSFRKACATNMYMLTKDILLVRNYLNHKDAKVTQTYIEY